MKPKSIYDGSTPIPYEKYERFVQHYFNNRDAEIPYDEKMARACFEVYGDRNKTRIRDINASTDVRLRIEYLYRELESGGLEYLKWNKVTAEDTLLMILNDPKTKPMYKLQAIQQLNTIRGVEAPEKKKEASIGDELSDFFSKFKGGL